LDSLVVVEAWLNLTVSIIAISTPGNGDCAALAFLITAATDKFGDFIDFSMLAIFVKVVSNFRDVTLAQWASWAIFQPGDEAQIIEVVVSTRPCFALFNQVAEADNAAFVCVPVVVDDICWSVSWRIWGRSSSTLASVSMAATRSQMHAWVTGENIAFTRT
jgi:hypothetical protein